MNYIPQETSNKAWSNKYAVILNYGKYNLFYNHLVTSGKNITEGIARGIATQSKTHKYMPQLLFDEFVVVVSSASGQPRGQRNTIPGGTHMSYVQDVLVNL